MTRRSEHYMTGMKRTSILPFAYAHMANMFSRQFSIEVCTHGAEAPCALSFYMYKARGLGPVLLIPT